MKEQIIEHTIGCHALIERGGQGGTPMGLINNCRVRDCFSTKNFTLPFCYGLAVLKEIINHVTIGISDMNEYLASCRVHSGGGDRLLWWSRSLLL